METKYKAKEIFDYCEGYLSNKKTSAKVKKEMIDEIVFLIDTD